MRVYTTSKAKIALVVLLLMFIAVFVPTQKTFAAIGGCRSDPEITLSNGQVVDLAAQVSRNTNQVRSVSYELYGPRGTTVSNYVDTSELANVTTFSFHATEAGGRYSAWSTVQTAGNATVVFTMTLGTDSYTVGGVDGQSLNVHN